MSDRATATGAGEAREGTSTVNFLSRLATIPAAMSFPVSPVAHVLKAWHFPEDVQSHLPAERTYSHGHLNGTGNRVIRF